ncbi:hypothetical protein FRC04_011293 [Tulasnella sp. 424]|nr:hypothetical protein FRC04_011293 [Tulasnella sp. 424]KAG8971829.1 hypothetical protein FRC05_010790 [Tulasnella sp. 425]
MHFSAVVLIITAAAFGTSASAVAPRALVSVNLASSSLLSRQVATACVATCNPVQNEVTTCGVDPTCLCTPKLASELSDCANCRLKNDPTLRSQLETAWDQYSSGCASLGRPVSGGIDGGSSVTPTVIATPTTTTPAVVFTPSPIVTSAAAAASSAAPAVSFSAAPAAFTTSAASSSGSNSGSDSGGLVAHANAGPTLHAGGVFGLLVVGVVAALL